MRTCKHLIVFKFVSVSGARDRYIDSLKQFFCISLLYCANIFLVAILRNSSSHSCGFLQLYQWKANAYNQMIFFRFGVLAGTEISGDVRPLWSWFSFKHKLWQLLICVIFASSSPLILRLLLLYFISSSVPEFWGADFFVFGWMALSRGRTCATWS
jgi:hypothetical protein